MILFKNKILFNFISDFIKKYKKAGDFKIKKKKMSNY